MNRFCALVALAACSDYRENEGESYSQRDRERDRGELFPVDGQGTVARFKEKDPSLDKFFNTAYAYAVYPKVSKGAAGLGAANGKGDVYEQGRNVPCMMW